MHRRKANIITLFAILLSATLLLAGSVQSAGGHPGASTNHAAGLSAKSANPLGRRQSVDRPSANPFLESVDSLTGAASQQQAENVELVGQIGGVTEAVAVWGNYAYIGMGPRLVILDVADPAHPRVVGQTAPLPGVVWDVAVAGGYAYLADYDAGLRIIDVSQPAAPAEVGSFDSPGYAEGVAVAGGYAYLADGYAGLRIIDVSQPAAPAEVG
ncbi:MAG: LVIVD repeat-containing protein, partial [Acidimicrobiia bacterium]